jgi:hypothetical protein
MHVQGGRRFNKSRAECWGPIIAITIMYSVRNIRPLLRATVLRPSAAHARLVPLVPLRTQPSQYVRITGVLQQHRAVASHVAGRPGSQTISQAAVNVREEVGNSTTDWAKVIAGGNFTEDSVKPHRETFVSEPWINKTYKLR